MKRVETSLDKKNNLAEVRLLSIDNLKNGNNLQKLFEIIELFDLDDVLLSGSGFVNQGSALLTLQNDVDKSIEVNVQKTKKRLFSKKLYHEINVVFIGKWLRDIIKLAAKEDASLFIFPKEEDKVISRIEIIVNDNDCSTITFRTDKYDYDDMILKIEQILK